MREEKVESKCILSRSLYKLAGINTRLWFSAVKVQIYSNSPQSRPKKNRGVAFKKLKAHFKFK